MSTKRKLLIAFGAVIIAGIIAIGAFSLGVYVGEQGWTAASPSLTGPGARPPAGGQSPALAPPGRRPALIGPVQSVSDGVLTLRTEQGLRLVMITAETQVLRTTGSGQEEASLEDLRRGMRVAVFGNFGDDGRTLTAETVVILLSPQRQP